MKKTPEQKAIEAQEKEEQIVAAKSVKRRAETEKSETEISDISKRIAAARKQRDKEMVERRKRTRPKVLPISE